jgi:single-strand DNA-binding protein
LEAISMRSINRVVLTCGLTRDPKLRHTASGASVATLRVAFATGRIVEGEWQEKRNYVDVEVWGTQAESAEKHLSKGRQLAIDGRLEWSEYEGRDGSKWQGVRIVADNVQYLPLPAGSALNRSAARRPASENDEGAVDAGDEDAVETGNEDIPF